MKKEEPIILALSPAASRKMVSLFSGSQNLKIAAQSSLPTRPFQFDSDQFKQEGCDLSLYANPWAQPPWSLRYTSQPQTYRTAFSIMPGAKRPVADGPNGTPPVKHLKVEHPEEFSQAVKKKLQASNRTGQACDRCKVSHAFTERTGANRIRRFVRSDAME